MSITGTVPKVCEKCGAKFLAIKRNAGRFCSRQCYWDHGGGNTNRVGWSDPRLAPSGVDPSDPLARPDFAFAWGAGVFEGEGTCHGNQWRCKDGHISYSPAVRVNQVDPWLINKLQALFGGSVRLRHNKRENGSSDIIHSTGNPIGLNVAPRPFEIYEWNLNGDRARNFLRAIYDRLSPRRQAQVRKAFGISDDSHP